MHREGAEISTGFNGAVGKGSGSAYTFACTLSLAEPHKKESFEVSPLQDDHDIFMPSWLTLQNQIRYLYTGALSNIVFDSTKCVNCTKSAMTEFSIDHNESVAYFAKQQKLVAVISSLHIDEEENVSLEIPREIRWQYRDYSTVYNGQ